MLSLLVAISLADDWTGAQVPEAKAVESAAQPGPLATDSPLAQPYRSPRPSLELDAQVFLGAAPRERHRCSVTALVDAFGEVLDAAAHDCPRDLEASSTQAVRGWKFHPPMQGDKAVRGHYEVTFVYVGGSVIVPEKMKAERLVRAEPVAVPRWPQPPPTRGGPQEWLEEQGATSARCVLDFAVDKRNAPVDFELVDCPEELAAPLLRRLKRYGVDVRGASPGDGKLYRLEWVYEL